MGLRAVRAAHRMAAERTAVAQGIQKVQQQNCKETLQYAEQTDSSVVARQAERLKIEKENLIADIKNARVKMMTSGLKATVMAAVSLVAQELNKASRKVEEKKTKQADRQDLVPKTDKRDVSPKVATKKPVPEASRAEKRRNSEQADNPGRAVPHMPDLLLALTWGISSGAVPAMAVQAMNRGLKAIREAATGIVRGLDKVAEPFKLLAKATMQVVNAADKALDPMLKPLKALWEKVQKPTLQGIGTSVRGKDDRGSQHRGLLGRMRQILKGPDDVLGALFRRALGFAITQTGQAVSGGLHQLGLSPDQLLGDQLHPLTNANGLRSAKVTVDGQTATGPERSAANRGHEDASAMSRGATSEVITAWTQTPEAEALRIARGAQLVAQTRVETAARDLQAMAAQGGLRQLLALARYHWSVDRLVRAEDNLEGLEARLGPMIPSGTADRSQVVTEADGPPLRAARDGDAHRNRDGALPRVAVDRDAVAEEGSPAKPHGLGQVRAAGLQALEGKQDERTQQARIQQERFWNALARRFANDPGNDLGLTATQATKFALEGLSEYQRVLRELADKENLLALVAAEETKMANAMAMYREPSGGTVARRLVIRGGGGRPEPRKGK